MDVPGYSSRNRNPHISSLLSVQPGRQCNLVSLVQQSRFLVDRSILDDQLDHTGDAAHEEMQSPKHQSRSGCRPSSETVGFGLLGDHHQSQFWVCGCR